MDTTNPNPVPQAPVENKNGSVGPVIGAVIILAVIILGGLYFWNERQDRVKSDAETAQVIEAISTQSAADDTASIEADLDNTNLDILDAELQ